MIEVKTRTVEAWGPLASLDQNAFEKLISQPNARDQIKNFVKKQKKLKTFKVTFEKRWFSDQFELEAENDWDISTVAREFFKQNHDKIGFKEKSRDKWAGSYEGFDHISYVKVRG
jgi:hypothetical protein